MNKIEHKKSDTLLWEIQHTDTEDTVVDLTNIDINIRAKRASDGYVLFEAKSSTGEVIKDNAVNGEYRLQRNTGDFVPGVFNVDITYSANGARNSTETFLLVINKSV
jgi:hypothetical protein